jgi:hypothetical protein
MFRPQTKVEQLLDKIRESLVASGGGGLATEATLISVLNAIVAADQDIEILLVRDTGNGDVVLQQITDYQTGVPVVTYKDVNGNVVVPVGPLEYLDPSAVLNLMLTEITDQGLTLDSLESLLTTIDAVLDAIALDTASIAAEDFATETTLVATNALLTTIDAVLDTIKTDTTAMVVDLAAIEVLITTTNSLLTTIDAVLDTIKSDTANLVGASRTLNSFTAIASGSIPAGNYGGSVYNRSGVGTAVFNGITVARGEVYSWGAPHGRDTYNAINYTVSGGANLIVSYTT